MAHALTAAMKTDRGTINIRLFAEQAPVTVDYRVAHRAVAHKAPVDKEVYPLKCRTGYPWTSKETPDLYSVPALLKRYGVLCDGPAEHLFEPLDGVVHGEAGELFLAVAR